MSSPLPIHGPSEALYRGQDNKHVSKSDDFEWCAMSRKMGQGSMTAGVRDSSYKRLFCADETSQCHSPVTQSTLGCLWRREGMEQEEWISKGSCDLSGAPRGLIMKSLGGHVRSYSKHKGKLPGKL